MSRKSDAFQNWCIAEKLLKFPRIAAAAFQAGWNAAVENVIESIKNEAPLSVAQSSSAGILVKTSITRLAAFCNAGATAYGTSAMSP